MAEQSHPQDSNPVKRASGIELTDVFSPPWHAVALRETEERLAAGEEEVYTWEEVKAMLAKRN